MLAIVSARVLTARTRTTLEHCGFVLASFGTPEQALARLRSAYQAEVLLVDARDAPPGLCNEALSDLLMFARAAPWDARPLPVVLLAGSQLPTTIRDVCLTAGVHILPPYRQKATAIGRLLLRLCGVDERRRAAE